MNTHFLTGYRCNLFFYLLECVVAVVLSIIYDRLVPVALIGFIVFALVTSFILFRVNKKHKISESNHKKLQSFFYSVINVVMSIAFDSAQVFIYAMCFSTIAMFIFLDTKIAKFQMLQSVLMIILFGGFTSVVVGSRQTMLEFTFGSFVLIVINWVVLSMTSIITFQNRKSIEQERSLDDLLKVVEAKCDEAQAATRSKTRFLANMSHEIRTPINSVMGMNEMILRESTEEDIISYASEAKNATESLLGIINDILDITKIEEGKINILSVKYNLSDLINDVYNLVRFRAEAKNLKFEIVADENLPSVLKGDDIRLKQILTNLLTNAVKYTEKGSIVLEIKLVDNDEIYFSVKDTGIGIKEEDLPRLFNAFDRIEETRNRNIEGTGLGLNITSTFLKAFGSELKVKSEYGKGSEFSFVLKQEIIDASPIGIIDVNVRKTKHKNYSVVFEAPDARLLIVDDNEINRKVFINLLKRTKIKIDEAESGIESIELTKKNTYDIIFMDHMMPVMDGVEAFHIIRNNKDNPNSEIPVIVLTANAVIGAEEYYMKEGFNSFLSKPIDPKKLEQAVFENLNSGLIKKKSEAVNEEIQEEQDFEYPIIDGIDWSYAKLHLKDDKLILDTVKMFRNSLKSDIEELNSYYVEMSKEEVLDNYRVKVHSMKSSAALIGIVQLAGIAMELEKAARNGDTAVIKIMHPVFAKRWLSYLEPLKDMFEIKKSGAVATADMPEIVEIFDTIHKAAENMDVDTLDEMSRKLDEYNFEGSTAEKIDEVKKLIFNFEVEKLVNYEL